MTSDNTPLLRVLGKTCYRAPIRALDGFSSRLLLAEIEPQPRRLVRAYIKAYPPGSRGLVNEIIHWIICSALHLPQPAESYVLLIEHRKLAHHWPNIDWAGGSDCDLYPVFASLELDSAHPNTTHPSHRLDLLKADIMQWDKLCSAIAVHEWMANADANFSNFVRLGKHRWAMLDGGQIFGGDGWTPETLEAIRFIYNKLTHLLWDNGTPDAEYVARISDEAENHIHALEAAMPYIMQWIWDLCGEQDAIAAKNWLTRRASKSWMRTRFGERR